ncbi:MAG: transcriptional regulator [Acidimicrobiaceae bacterium]|nr:transcriptional regulator [Acidimicrobiaceae bacterium]
MVFSREVVDTMEAVWAGHRTAAEAESQILDFKEDAPSERETWREMAETCLCLANTDGGWIVQGVRDASTGPDAFLGTKLDPELLRARVRDLTRPALDIAPSEEYFHGIRLIVVSVEPSEEFHSDTKGRAPRRYGRECHPMDPVEQRRLREGRTSFDHSAQVASEQNLLPQAFDSARRLLRASLGPEKRALALLSDEDLCRALGALDDRGGYRRAAQTLLGEDGSSLVYQYKDTPGGEPRQIERLSGPLLVVYERVMELIRAHRRLIPLTLPTGQQLQIEDFPELVVREAVTNALMHRDLTVNLPVVVEHSPNVMAVVSPGPLVAGIEPTNILTHPSKPRNPLLAKACRVLELAEEIGRGVDRMYREMVRTGRPTPEITSENGYVRVTLAGGAPDLHIARYVAQQSDSFRDDTDAMLVLFKLCSSRTITASSMSVLLQKSEHETEASLKSLASDQVALIEPTRETVRRVHPTYRLRPDVVRALGTAVPYARNTSSDAEQRVVAHLREYGRITNSTVQNLFNVRVDRANQILRDLRDRNIIVRTSNATRGPSVEYGIGTNFPPLRKQARRAAQPGQGILNLKSSLWEE